MRRTGGKIVGVFLYTQMGRIGVLFVVRFAFLLFTVFFLSFTNKKVVGWLSCFLDVRVELSSNSSGIGAGRSAQSYCVVKGGGP